MIYPCSEAECSDEQEDDDTITNMEDEVIAVTISHSVPVTNVITTTHHDHNLSLPTHHHHHCVQHSNKGYSPYHLCIVERYVLNLSYQKFCGIQHCIRAVN